MTQVSRKGFRDKNGKQVVLKDPTKADKVENATAGNLASLDAEGNLQDSGKKPADFVPKVSGATAGNLASLDAEGNPTDSGYKPSDFAPATGSNEYAEKYHSHNYIVSGDPDPRSAAGASVDTDVTDGAKVTIHLVQGIGAATYKIAEITMSNIDNLIRALLDPDVPRDPSALDYVAKPITNGQVWTAIQNAGGLVVDSALSSSSTNAVQNKVVNAALLGKEGVIRQAILVYDNNFWKLSAAQDLEDMNLNDIQYCIFKIMPSASITYYAFGSLRRIWDGGQNEIEVQVAVLGHLLSWSDQVQDEQEAEGYRFNDTITLTIQSTNLFPTT